MASPPLADSPATLGSGDGLDDMASPLLAAGRPATHSNAEEAGPGDEDDAPARMSRVLQDLLSSMAFMEGLSIETLVYALGVDAGASEALTDAVKSALESGTITAASFGQMDDLRQKELDLGQLQSRLEVIQAKIVHYNTAEADVKESIRVKRCAIAEATEISLPAKEMTDRVGAFLVILRAREAQLVKDEEAYRTVLAEINDVSTNKKTLTSDLTTRLASFADRRPAVEVERAQHVLAEWCTLHASMQTNGEALRKAEAAEEVELVAGPKRKSLKAMAKPTKRARTDPTPPRPLRPQDEELLQASFKWFRLGTFKSGDITKKMCALTSYQKRDCFRALEAHNLVTGVKVDADNPKSQVEYRITSAGKETVLNATAKLLNGDEEEDDNWAQAAPEEDDCDELTQR